MTDQALTEACIALDEDYRSGVTLPYAYRRQQLELLRDAILGQEAELHAALYTDLKKGPEESYVTETGFVLAEIRHALHHLRRWMKPRRVPTNLLNFPSSSQVFTEPLGVVLIIAPWNYPLQLLFGPLVAALAAGNHVVLKPSEFAPATSAIMGKIIRETFPPSRVLMVEGEGALLVPALMKAYRFAHVFYTGSTAVGQAVYQMAAARLVPVTLELGGKSPCVVTADSNIRVAARRIAQTKFSNAGQMCVAPDYVLVHESVRAAFLEALSHFIRQFYTAEPDQNEAYGCIINERQARRLVAYLDQGEILYGGRYDIAKRYLEPTLIAPYSPDSPIMQEELFGPILPVISYQTQEEALALIRRNPDPLAFYLFSSDASSEKSWLQGAPSGGACINNCSWHLTNPDLPFGGRGNSGIGAYHGFAGFLRFSHQRSVLKTPSWFDPSLKYPPFKGKMRFFKWLVR